MLLQGRRAAHGLNSPGLGPPEAVARDLTRSEAQRWSGQEAQVWAVPVLGNLLFGCCWGDGSMWS